MKETFPKEQIHGELIYSKYLFPDDTTGNHLGNWVVKALSKRFGTELYDDFEYFGLHDTLDDQVKTCAVEDVREKYGGQKEFFKRGARILDLGSKSGLATVQFTDEEKDVHVIGLEEHYKEMLPTLPGQASYVSGNEFKLPFRDDTFTGIMALRTFPEDVNNSNLFETKNFEEITRVAKEGAIYRAIPPSGYLPLVSDEFKHTDKLRIVNLLAINGWETFYTDGLLIAKLVEKPR